MASAFARSSLSSTELRALLRGLRPFGDVAPKLWECFSLPEGEGAEMKAEGPLGCGEESGDVSE